MNFSLTVHTPEETEAFAATLATFARVGDVIALTGTLGAGKTTFARGFIQALAGNSEVTSPTFTLVQIYDARDCPLWHCDFYRIEEERELLQLGLEEAFAHAVTLIEWPEVAAAHLPQDTLFIHLSHPADGTERTLKIIGNDAWNMRLEDIARGLDGARFQLENHG